MQFGELITSLATKAGIQKDNETLKKLLAFSEAAQYDVPDEFFKPLEERLLTEESAKVNPKVRGALFAEYSNSVENQLDKYVDDWGFDDSFKGEYKAIEKDTKTKMKRIGDKMQEKLKELNEKASKPATKDDIQLKQEIQALKNQIETLNREAGNVKASYESQIQNLQERSLSDKKTYAFRTLLAGKPLPKNNLPQSVNILTAENLINQELAKNALQFHLDEFGNLILKQRKEGTDMDFFVNNKKVEASDFIDGVLAQNKFVQINDPNPPTNGTGTKAAVTAPSGIPTNSAIAQETQMQLDQLLGMTV